MVDQRERQAWTLLKDEVMKALDGSDGVTWSAKIGTAEQTKSRPSKKEKLEKFDKQTSLVHSVEAF